MDQWKYQVRYNTRMVDSGLQVVSAFQCS